MSVYGPRETGFEPPCAHCGTKAQFWFGHHLYPKDKERKALNWYRCPSCAAEIEAIGLRPAGTPASPDMRKLREEIKEDLHALARRKARRDDLPLLDAQIAAIRWVEKSLSIVEFEVERLNAQDAERVAELLRRYV